MAVLRYRWYIGLGTSAVLLSAIMIGLCVYICESGGVKVTIVNSTGASIDPVRVVFTGGESESPPLEAGASATVTVRPTSDSALSVSYQDANGAAYRNDLDLYICRGIRGGINITLLPEGKVDFWQSTYVAGF